MDRPAGDGTAGEGAAVIVSIMQPYFFPYLGYFQLIRNCDVFVLHDDVQYIKSGWVNRNRILVNGAPAYLTLPVLRGASRLNINQRSYQLEEKVVQRIVRRLDAAYREAPHFEPTMSLLRELLAFEDPNVAAFNGNLIRRISAHLGLAARIVESSALAKEAGLRQEERVIDICRVVGATKYVNSMGGVGLYSTGGFARKGIDLGFLEPGISGYRQFGGPHVPHLSVIDALMFNDRDGVRRLLAEFSLVSPP